MTDRQLHSQEPLGSWGNEYVRNLAGEIGQEFQERRDNEQSTEDLLELVSQIVPYHMSHNAGEAKAACSLRFLYALMLHC